MDIPKTPVLILLIGITLAAPLFVTTASADHYAEMEIIGVPASAGPWSWPVDSEYSWLSHRFPAATTWHSWRLHPGTDGGIQFGSAQPPGELTAEFLMFNISTSIYSTGNGVTINTSETVNLDNLRRLHGNTVYDLGSGAGADPNVPLVPDVTQLLPGENGWQINPDSTYHMIYNTAGNCAGCEMLLHFYGNLLPVMADGDINGDGKINVADILLAERHVAGLVQLTPGQIARGDLAPAENSDGALTIADIYLIFGLSQQ